MDIDISHNGSEIILIFSKHFKIALIDVAIYKLIILVIKKINGILYKICIVFKYKILKVIKKLNSNYYHNIEHLCIFQ